MVPSRSLLFRNIAKRGSALEQRLTNAAIPPLYF
jgi:hypothetical protein